MGGEISEVLNLKIDGLEEKLASLAKKGQISKKRVGFLFSGKMI
ncbi:hypothetical protein [uncultured Methanolobus sp.]|nr:hypothetical protein [uncultured Methanolobus sp.]